MHHANVADVSSRPAEGCLIHNRRLDLNKCLGQA